MGFEGFVNMVFDFNYRFNGIIKMFLMLIFLLISTKGLHFAN